MPSVTINITADVLSQGAVSVAMYGLVNDAWVYFDGSAYQNISSSVPAFATFTSESQLPATYTMPDDTTIASGAFIFGIGGLPPIVSNGTPTEPNPIGITTVYDVAEFSYTAAAGTAPSSLYLNTTNVDQFGIPMQIDITPASLVLPDGAGVIVSREDLFSSFATYVTAYPVFAQCANDLFGNPMSERILSPGFALQSAVTGVVALNLPNVNGTLAPGTYFYIVTAVSTDTTPIESYAQYNVASFDVAALGDSVQVAWSNPQPWPSSLIGGYHIYRGTPSGSGVTWAKIGSVDSGSFGFGDTGQSAIDSSLPSMNPLNTYFDQVIKTFFNQYTNGTTITLTATDGTNDGYVYSFEGAFANGMLTFSLQSVVDDEGNTVSSPPINLGTAFNIYSPFWNSNTFNTNNPAPPSWGPNNDVPASAMVFAAMGVFADSAYQPVPAGANGNSTMYATLLGALENQVVAAITRGITNLAISPQNWGNGTAPSISSAQPAAGQSTLSAGTTYYYVMTAINANGETIASLEFNATPSTDAPCVALTWLPMPLTTVTKYRIYRGTVSQQENEYVEVANAQNPVTSFVDSGFTGKRANPPMYFPSGNTWDAYDAFLHQPSISQNGASYAAPYDDQGGQSSTLSTSSPTAFSISLGPWS